jgi:hypothetical protein
MSPAWAVIVLRVPPAPSGQDSTGPTPIAGQPSSALPVRTFFTVISRARFRRARPSGSTGFGREHARASRDRASWRANEASSRGGMAGTTPIPGRAACRALSGGSPQGAAPPPGQQAHTRRHAVSAATHRWEGKRWNRSARRAALFWCPPLRIGSYCAASS